MSYNELILLKWLRRTNGGYPELLDHGFVFRANIPREDTELLDLRIENHEAEGCYVKLMYPARKPGPEGVAVDEPEYVGMFLKPESS